MKALFPLLVLAISQLAFAQNQAVNDQSVKLSTEEGNTEKEDFRYPQEFLEEITVVGERNFLIIRQQIERAENNLYSIFNDLNSSDEFDIKCRETWWRHIKSRYCEPHFLTQARQRNAVNVMAGMRNGPVGSVGSLSNGGELGVVNGSLMLQEGMNLLKSDSTLNFEEGDMFEALNAEMLRIAVENQDYLEALMRVGKLKDVLQEEREKRFGK